MLLSTGERISCALCAMAIHDMGHEAISLTGSQAGIVTDSSHTKARIIDVRADRIREALDEDRIVLVAGFQGVSTDSRDVTTLGRGGSDTTAVALAAALGAERLRDLHRRRRRLQRRPADRPRRPQAADASPSRRCWRCRPRAPRCCSCARSSTRATTASASTAAAASRTAPVPSSSPEDETMERPFVTAVTHSDDEARVTLTGVRDEPGVAGRIFSALAEANVNVDVIIQNEPVGDDAAAPTSPSPSTAPTCRPPTDTIAALGDVSSGRRAPTSGSARSRSSAPACARHPGVAAKVFEVLGDERDQHRDDLHLADQDLLRDRRRPGPRRGEGPAQGVRARRRRGPPEDPTGADHRPTVAG